MIETLMAAVASWGGLALAGILAVNCLGVPMPTSLLMLAAGGLAADGDLELVDTAALAILGAAIGDQIGYWVGRVGGPPVVAAVGRRLRVGAAIRRAEVYARQRGALSIFLTRWLLSPLGPYVNLIVGVARVPWPVFLLWSVLGEALWVCVYIGLGFGFSDQVGALAEVLGDAVWFVLAGTIAVALGYKLFGRRDAARGADA